MIHQILRELEKQDELKVMALDYDLNEICLTTKNGNYYNNKKALEALHNSLFYCTSALQLNDYLVSDSGKYIFCKIGCNLNEE